MMRLFFGGVVLTAVIVATLWAAELGFGPVVITKEYEYKIVLLFGNPMKVITQPGYAFRIPFATEVKTFGRKLRYLNAEPVELNIANDEKLIVDYYAIWRITDPLAYLNAFPTGEEAAHGRIKRSINSEVQAQVARLGMTELLARAEILSNLSDSTNAALTGDGVEIVDVRINRTELPRKSEPAAFEQMREQRRAVSRERRAMGERQAREIRAEAERVAQIEVAKAKSEAQVLMGEGDAEAARIYAEAYGEAPEFYAFIRSLEAYRKTLGSGTTMVLPPNHEFFRFLQPELTLRDERAGRAANHSLPPVDAGPPTQADGEASQSPVQAP